MTRTFRKTIPDHRGPGADTVREFELSETEITQRDDGVTIQRRTITVRVRDSWIQYLPVFGFEEVMKGQNE